MVDHSQSHNRRASAMLAAMTTFVRAKVVVHQHYPGVIDVVVHAPRVYRLHPPQQPATRGQDLCSARAARASCAGIPDTNAVVLVPGTLASSSGTGRTPVSERSARFSRSCLAARSGPTCVFTTTRPSLTVVVGVTVPQGFHGCFQIRLPLVSGRECQPKSIVRIHGTRGRTVESAEQAVPDPMTRMLGPAPINVLCTTLNGALTAMSWDNRLAVGVPAGAPGYGTAS